MCRTSASATLPHFGVMCSLMMPLVANLARAGQVAAAGEPIHHPGTGQQFAVRGLDIEPLQLGHFDRRRKLGRLVFGLEAALVGLAALRGAVPDPVPLAPVGQEVRLDGRHGLRLPCVLRSIVAGQRPGCQICVPPASACVTPDTVCVNPNLDRVTRGMPPDR